MRASKIIGKPVILILLLGLVERINAWNKMCSVLCTNQSCSTNAYGNCTANGCQSPWTWNTTLTACELTAASGWSLVDVSSDIGGAILPDNGNTATCGPQSGGSNWAYTYTGNLTGNNVLIYTDSNGPQVAFYQIRVIFWMILIDNWQGSDTIKATIHSNSSMVQTMNRNNRQAS